MKRKPSDLSAADQLFTRKVLFEAAKTAKTNKQLEKFLEGLLTPSEQIMLGRRIWISRMLLEQKRYDEIGARLHVGPNTVAKVEMWLRGLLPDYGDYLNKEVQVETLKRRKRIAKENPFGLTALKMKYPLHFLLFPWPKE
ncbi:MAG: Trp repressor protein [Candidatus Parcubacteria bacterium]|jgi:Trp operon repressor